MKSGWSVPQEFEKIFCRRNLNHVITVRASYCPWTYYLWTLHGDLADGSGNSRLHLLSKMTNLEMTLTAKSSNPSPDHSSSSSLDTTGMVSGTKRPRSGHRGWNCTLQTQTSWLVQQTMCSLYVKKKREDKVKSEGESYNTAMPYSCLQLRLSFFAQSALFSTSIHLRQCTKNVLTT